MKTVKIYTDGACSGNPGPGGWAAILIYKGKEKIITGGSEETTNNIMELTAVIEGLSALKEPCKAEIFSDSNYVVGSVNNGYLSSWVQHGWKTADKKPVKNVQLWQSLIPLLTYHSVEFNKVKGHSDDLYNNRCDALARAEISKLT
ncbi:MAG: ribonuclease HI [Clostridia bacterium]|nr:ribonuclease HI [Clostridia bacterium]